jgi:hypothetical protein
MDPSETSRDENPGSESSIDYNRPADNPSGRSLEELVDQVDAETLDQRRHERSTSDPRDMKRCPACGSVKLHQKTGGPCGTRKPGDYRCDGCNHHFDEPVVDDETADGTADVVTDGGHPPGHSPDPSAADRSSAAEYYVVDEARPAVVDGPLPMARAKSLANEHGPDHVVASRDAVRLLESAGDATVRWETDEDVDVVTDGGQPAGLDEVELRIRTARANIAGLIPIFGMGVQAAQDGGALKGRADQFVSQIYDELEAEYPEADRREDLLDTVSHTSQHGGSWVPLEVSIDDVNEDADGAFEEVR